jgi:putative membrane protein
VTATQGRLAGLSKFIFRAPRWPRTLAFAVLLGGLTGIAVFDSTSTIGSTYPVLLIGQDAWQGIVFLAAPTVVAALATTPLDRWLGGSLTHDRSALLALCCELLVVLVLVVAGVLAAVFGLSQRFVFDVLVVALASIFAVRLLAVLAVSRLPLPLATVPAAVQTAAAAALLFVYGGTARLLLDGDSPYQAYVLRLSRPDQSPPVFDAVTIDHFLLLGALCLLYAVAVWGFLVGIDRPWRRSLDVSVLDFIHGFIGYAAEESRDLERFFERLGQDAVVPVSVLSFRTIDGQPSTDGGSETASEADGDVVATDHLGEEKARFVLPMIHPGPLGEIGGGDLPRRVAVSSEGLGFPPHATAGHDFNLVSETEVDGVIRAADRVLDSATYRHAGTPPQTVAAGESTMLSQGFGDAALAVSTFAPGSADDVDFAVGQSAIAEFRTGGVDDVLLVDGHNSHTGLSGSDLGHVTPGSERSYDLYEAAATAGAAVADAPEGTLELGVAWAPTPWTPDDGIGPLGVRVAVTRVAGVEAAYVLIDGNNMIPGLRADLLEAVRDATDIDHVEVMTTDNHVVNRTEADNRVGERVDETELARIVRSIATDAHDDLEPVAVGGGTERATVTVFGNDRTETLATQANAALSLGAALAAAVTLFAMAVSVLLFFLA